MSFSRIRTGSRSVYHFGIEGYAARLVLEAPNSRNHGSKLCIACGGVLLDYGTKLLIQITAVNDVLLVVEYLWIMERSS